MSKKFMKEILVTLGGLIALQPAFAENIATGRTLLAYTSSERAEEMLNPKASVEVKRAERAQQYCLAEGYVRPGSYELRFEYGKKDTFVLEKGDLLARRLPELIEGSIYWYQGSKGKFVCSKEDYQDKLNMRNQGAQIELGTLPLDQPLYHAVFTRLECSTRIDSQKTTGQRRARVQEYSNQNTAPTYEGGQGWSELNWFNIGSWLDIFSFGFKKDEVVVDPINNWSFKVVSNTGGGLSADLATQTVRSETVKKVIDGINNLDRAIWNDLALEVSKFRIIELNRFYRDQYKSKIERAYSPHHVSVIETMVELGADISKFIAAFNYGDSRVYRRYYDGLQTRKALSKDDFVRFAEKALSSSDYPLQGEVIPGKNAHDVRNTDFYGQEWGTWTGSFATLVRVNGLNVRVWLRTPEKNQELTLLHSFRYSYSFNPFAKFMDILYDPATGSYEGLKSL